ncbi:hypothetical protein TRFO_02144 [Tritrichomonas foetus]|uniref:Rab-GAP TBC domain-containing protein n=1 Tax=Tritrichomonas foetus TaxID=1144522 RepID=A0A1J4JD50_9EUKA|nr:hypothetical protein TRFO_02144 [Tritrichomonas foetus]|eukprot:OHS95204.1 hypothetical protein TRFO_02144 [Tritrichomonas foetus]
MTFLPACWLVPGDPGPFPAPFDRSYDDFNRFKAWFQTLTSVSDPKKIIDQIVLTYNSIKGENIDLFDFNCIESNPTNPIHKKIRYDVLKSIHKLRKEYDLSVVGTRDDEKIENVIGRILIYASINEIEYRRGFCDLIMPIMHVYYYGILGSYDIDFDLPLVEALVADSFVRFMTGPIVNHIRVFTETKYVNDLSARFMDLLKPYPIYSIMTNDGIEPKFFLNKWINLVFIQELDFPEVIKIWDHLFENCTPGYFHLKLISLAAGATLAKESKCKVLPSYQHLETIQAIEDLVAEEIIFRAL